MRFSRIDLWQRFKVFGAFFSVPLAIACDGDLPTDDGSAAEPSSNDAPIPTEGFGIRGYIETGNTLTRISYVPGRADANANDLGTVTPSSASAFAPSLRLQGYQDCTEGCEPGGDPEGTQHELIEGFSFTGARLVQDVLETCLIPPTFIEGSRPYLPFPGFQEPWGGDTGWYIFNGKGDTCDDILIRQELTLCVADRLAEIADAADTVRYEINDTSTLIFPPQDLKDKFIVRDLAINAIAHIALLDLENPLGQPSGTTLSGAAYDDCTKVYTAVFDDPQLVAFDEQSPYIESYSYAFSGNPFDSGAPQNLFSDYIGHFDADGIRRDVLHRANVKAHILGSAGTLLRDLLDKSLQADLAGAETRRGQTGDPSLGLMRMWGVANESNEPYDSLRHALRLIFGRLEIGEALPSGQEAPLTTSSMYYRPKWDPKCGGQPGNAGVEALDLIYGLGDGFSARWHDAAPKTAAQSLAMSTIQQMGLVLLPSALSDMAAASDAVKGQLYLHNAASQGLTLQEFTDSPYRQLVDEVFDGLSVADLQFGLERSFDAYRLLTNSPADLTQFPAQAPGGLTFAEGDEVAADVVSAGGRVVVGGVPRRDLLVDAMAGMGAAQVASQCSISGDALSTSSSLSAAATAFSTFQDPFMLGGRLTNRLALLEDGLTDGGGSASDDAKTERDGIATTLAGSIAGLRSWSSKAIAQIGLSTTPNPDRTRLRLTGLVPEDLGVTELEDMPGQLTVILGETWQAECAAGLRSSCPDPVPGILTPTSTTVEEPGFAAGYRGSSILFEYLSNDHPVNAPALDESRYYIVVKSDPGGGRVGRVLGALAPPRNQTQRQAGISDYQHHLANLVFGTGDPERRGRTCSNDVTTALPSSYCITGMDRDMFVPLANELTSEGGQNEDSWRHYLRIAEEAALRADELGKEMIAAGFQREIRREGAQEQLGTLCGTYVPVDSLYTDYLNGGVAGSQVDAEINECISPETYDLVFLTDNAPFLTEAELRAAYCEGLDPDETAPAFCSKATISRVTLGLPSYSAVALPTSCNTIIDAAEQILEGGNDLDSMIQGLEKLQALASEDWVEGASIGAGVTQLKYAMGLPMEPSSVIANDNTYHWAVTRAGDPFIVPSATFAGNPAWTALTLKEQAEIYPHCLTLSTTELETEGLCSSTPEGQATGVPSCETPCLGDARSLARILGTGNTAMYDIEAALWYAGAMAGRLPSGTLTLPVTAYNRTPGDPASIEAAEFYATGRLIANTTDNSYALEATQSGPPEQSVAEAQAMGKFYPAPLNYWQTRAADEAKFSSPAWRSFIYNTAVNDAGDARHLISVNAANSSLLFDEAVQTPGGRVIHRDEIREWIADFASSVRTTLAGSGACGNDGTALMASLNTNGEFVEEGADEDAYYAQIPRKRNLCFSGKYPVFYEDLDSHALHARTYFQARAPRKTTDEDEFSPTPGFGTLPLGDLVTNTYGLTELTANGGGGSFVLFDYPIDMTQFPGEVFSPVALGDAGGPVVSRSTDSFFPTQCATSPATPSRFGTGCLAGTATAPSFYHQWHQNDCVLCTGDRWETLSTEASLIGRRLRPTECSPGDRVELFVNRYPKSNCDAARAVAQGLALSCMGTSQAKFELSDLPPPIKTIHDLRKYEGWIVAAETTLSTLMNSIAFQNLPKSVVDRFKAKSVTSELASGDFGERLYDLANQLESLHLAWHSVGSGFAELRSAVSSARLQIEGLEGAAQEKELLLAQQSLELSRQVAMAELDQVASVMKLGAACLPTSCGIKDVGCSWSPPSIAMAAIDVYRANRQGEITSNFARETEKLLGKLQVINQQGEATEKAQVAEEFNRQAHHALDAVEQGVSGVRTAGNNVLSARGRIEQVSSNAQWELGKVMGKDFVAAGTTSDGSPILVPQHVNTVLNRQYNILRIRYEHALEQAKKAAYLARLSIEQRLGIRFDDLDEAIGPLPPPSGWIDDLCSLQGINYSELRCAGDVDPQTGECLDFEVVGVGEQGNPVFGTFDDVGSNRVQNFANQYIGDYVGRLKELVEFYNVEFPFREADDVAILSLRDNLLAPDVACRTESTNLLFYSDALQMGGLITADFESLNGWRAHRCGRNGCMSLFEGKTLRNPDPNALGADLTQPGAGLDVVPPDDYGGVTWLSFSGPEDDTPSPDQDPSPPGSVYQSVALKSGSTYLLSWWDMARLGDGLPMTDQSIPKPYRAAVFDGAWGLVAVSEIAATHSSEAGTAWSERHQLEIVAPEDGNYHVAFYPSNPSTDMSLAIANVQLQEISDDLAGLTPYIQTDGKRQVSNEACAALDKNELLTAFTRRCEGGRGDELGRAPACFYELNKHIVIDAESHNLGFGALGGQISVGNSNLRHVDLAVNLVGTGILDCSESANASCYGSAFVEYDLEHLAYNAAIQNQRDQTSCFNFGTGRILGGKAMAAERFLTLPLASTDRELLAEAAFTKTELFGRPLSGVYTLRLRDNPALVFDRLEDIQILMRYRYWSRVDRTAN